MDRETVLDMNTDMLVSLINLKLRDYYESLDDFCYEVDIDKSLLEDKLKKSNYQYNEKINQIR